MKKMKFKIEELEIGDIIKYLSIGGGGILLFIGIFAAILLSPTIGVMLFVLAVFVGIVPYSFYKYFQFVKYKKMEEHFPTFMRDLAEAKKSGMTFPQALEMSSKSDYGALTPEIIRATNQLSWGISFPKVMGRFSKRLKGSKIMNQAITIIIQSYNSGGDIAETMDSLAMNIGTIRGINEQRKSIMSQQIFIMYFIFALFLGIIVGLYKLLIPMMAIKGTAVTAGMGSFGLSAVDYCLSVPWLCAIGEAFGFGTGSMVYFKTLFLVMCIIQAISCGVIAGQIGENSIVAGTKHIAIMAVAAFVVFFTLVR